MARAPLLALLVLAGANAGAAPAETAGLGKFELQAYRNHFDPAQTDELEKRAAELIAANLHEHVPFLEFTAQGGSSFTLKATLRARLAPERAGAPGEVVLQFSLGGAGQGVQPEFI